MPAKASRIVGRTQPESQQAITGAFCLGWSATSGQLTVDVRMSTGGAACFTLPVHLANFIQSHASGAFSP
jgi:hypothetical protein